MIKNIKDYSKAIFHIENLKQHSIFTTEDHSIQFLINCMKENLESEELSKLKNEFTNLKFKYLPFAINKLETDKIRFIITTKNKDYLIKYLESKSKDIDLELCLIEKAPIFLNNKNRLFIPLELDITKDYTFIGNFPIYIDSNKVL